MELLAEYDTEVLPQDQTAEAFETLSRVKQELAGALGNFQVQTDEIEANEKRLSQSQEDEQALLGAEMDETEQVEKINRLVSLQRLLGARIEQGRKRIESIELELRQQVEETHRSFGKALSALLTARQTKHLNRLKEMVEPAQWPWCEVHATAFIGHTPDLLLLNTLGEKTTNMLRSGTPRRVAENLLMDISKLEGEIPKGR
jgi:hypothetical protein